MALIVSIVALAVSSLLTARQVRLLKDANHIPAVIELLTEFRSAGFHDRYMQVVTGLPPATPSTGVSDLPQDIRAAVLDIAYYFQAFGNLIGLGILDERRVLTMLSIRFINVWDAIEPFVGHHLRVDQDPGAIGGDVVRSRCGTGTTPAASRISWLLTRMVPPQRQHGRRVRGPMTAAAGAQALRCLAA